MSLQHDSVHGQAYDGFHNHVQQLIRDLEATQDEAQQTGPVAPPILDIHRGEDGFVAFTRIHQTSDGQEGKGEWQYLFSIEVQELQSMFPTLRDWLLADSYFSINSMYRAAPWISKITGLPDVWRKEKHLRYLNACYVDLDVGRPDDVDPLKRRTWQEALSDVCLLMAQGAVPQASLIARSGRGLYLFWFLYDEKKPDSPPRHWDRKLILYKQINVHLQESLKSQAADHRASDGARVLRAPGSRHVKAQQNVTYLMQLDEAGRGYAYTLRELADFLAVPLVKSSLPPNHGERVDPLQADPASRPQYGRATIKPGSVPSRYIGPIELSRYRCNDLVCLEQWFGGWPKGKRYKRLELYAQFLHRAGNDRIEALNSVRIMAANCRPPYPSDRNDTQLEQIINVVFSKPPKAYSNANLVKWLGLTPELEEVLELQTIMSDEIKLKRQPPPGGQSAIERKRRRELIQHLWDEHGVHSCREMQESLRSRGIEVCHETINKDLNFLNYKATDQRFKRCPNLHDLEEAGQNHFPFPEIDPEEQ